MSAPRLLATCWTTAGDAAPKVRDERSPFDLGDRMRAAVAAGFEGFGIVHADLVAYRDANGLDSLRRLAEDSGVQQLELEFIGDWWTDGDLRAASDTVRRDLFEAAAALGVPTVKIAGATDEVPEEGLFHSELHALAEEARGYGVRLALEPLPFASIKTIQDGARMLELVGNDNVGLCVDIWHVFRMHTPYSDIPRVLRGDQIFVVELDDGTAEPVGSMWDDTIDRRLYPGRGAFDVPAFIRAIDETGFDGYWGVEVISAAHRARPLSESLTEVRDDVLACFAQARGDA
jgi:sugar phosphate isomerase/epimerase